MKKVYGICLALLLIALLVGCQSANNFVEAMENVLVSHNTSGAKEQSMPKTEDFESTPSSDEESSAASPVVTPKPSSTPKSTPKPKPEYLKKLTQLGEEETERLEETAEDIIEERIKSYRMDSELYSRDLNQFRISAGGRIIPKIEFLRDTEIEVDSIYLLTPKNDADKKTENSVSVLCKCVLEYDGEGGEMQTEVYYGVTFDNIMITEGEINDLNKKSGNVSLALDPYFYSFYDLYEELVYSKSLDFNIDEEILSKDHEKRMKESPLSLSSVISGRKYKMICYSSQRKLIRADLRGMNLDDLAIARNEIFAVHGRGFNDEELKKHFEEKDWYRETVSADEFDSAVFSEYEKYNVDFIKSHEKLMYNGIQSGDYIYMNKALPKELIGTWSFDTERFIEMNGESPISKFGSIFKMGDNELSITAGGDISFWYGANGGSGECYMDGDILVANVVQPEIGYKITMLFIREKDENSSYLVAMDASGNRLYWRR